MPDNSSKLVLGTAQFGSNYGIKNYRGRIPKDEVFSIIETAIHSGSLVFDTSPLYGDAEVVLGDYIRQNGDLLIISKLQKCSIYNATIFFKQTFDVLGVSSLYAYLLHDFSAYLEDSNIWNFMLDLRKSHKAKKIGFSLYHPEEIDILLRNNVDFDIVQVPYSLFDRRFEKYFKILKDKNVEIHVRSIFLQGLLLFEPENLPQKFLSVKSKLVKLRGIASKYSTTLTSLCLNLALDSSYINKIIVGVDSKENFDCILKDVSTCINLSKEDKEEIDCLREENESIILPYKWSKI